ncbi:hypothetical protein NQ317_000137 [Molorchus minor]|uniref:SURF1-like protein n=1 Tax=Molorchus minor TaxID=1323400 RepID=A0ABQ9JUD8_9CUCU|nr:hypothetical protein NQ317_000137 [Molorchus minor]
MELSFFRFPKDPIRCSIWLRNCGRADLNLSPEALYSAYVVCSLHFENEMFSSLLKNRLKKNAVPTLFDFVLGKSSKIITSTSILETPSEPVHKSTIVSAPMAVPVSVSGETPITTGRTVETSSELLAEIQPQQLEEKKQFFFGDLQQMSAATGSLPIFLDATNDFDVPDGPIGGQTRVSLRNEHLSYILTWFALGTATSYMWYTRFIK